MATPNQDWFNDGVYVRDPLKPGMCGEDVRSLQENLAKLGITDAQGKPIPIDGAFSPEMAEAVRKLGGMIAADQYDKIMSNPDLVGTESRKAAEAQTREQHIADGMRIPEVGAHSWTLMEEMMRDRGLEVSRPGNDSETQFLDDYRYDKSGNSQAPPPRTEGPLVCAPVAHGGGDGGSVPTAAAGGLNADPLYASLRQQLPQTVPDAKVAEVALKSAQGDMRDPAQVQSAAVVGERIFVAGKTPGYLVAVDLTAPAPPIAETAAGLSALAPDKALQPEVQQSQGGRSVS